MLVQRWWRVGRCLAVALLTAASLPVRPGSAGATEADCPQPTSHKAAVGCVWTGADYMGTMTVHEGSGGSSSPGCRDASPRSAVNHGPGGRGAHYSFSFYHHVGCEKGGKFFGVLPPGQDDPELPDVQSYAWKRSGG